MTSIRIDTDGVLNVSRQIDTINNKLLAEFSPVKSAVKKLDSSWDGSVATAAMRHFNAISSSFEKDGIKILKDYSRYLSNHVATGYENTEDTNTKLADRFK